MKKPSPQQGEKYRLPIHWIKPTAFKIPIPRDEKQRLAALHRHDILGASPGKTNDELYRKRFLPSVTDADLDRLARKALHEKVSEDKLPHPLPRPPAMNIPIRK